MDNKQKLTRMATWTVTVFATIFAVVMAVMWLLTYPVVGKTAFQVLQYILGLVWYLILLAGGLCVGVYFVYSVYIRRKK